MADDTRGWFFVVSRTTQPDGATRLIIRGGGRPAMVLAIGFVFVAIYAVMMVFSDPPWQMSSISAGVTALLFGVLAGLQMYLAERNRRPDD